MKIKRYGHERVQCNVSLADAINAGLTHAGYDRGQIEGIQVVGEATATAVAKLIALLHAKNFLTDAEVSEFVNYPFTTVDE